MSGKVPPPYPPRSGSKPYDGPGFWSLDHRGRLCGRMLDPDPSELGPPVRA